MFMARSNSLGIHFYGKMTSSVNIEYGSTMESILREATIFGKVRKRTKQGEGGVCEYVSRLNRLSLPSSQLPFVSLGRSGGGSAFCVVAEDEKRIAHETKSTLFLTSWKKPASVTTHPKDPREFYFKVVEANGNVLACHEGWPGIRDMTHKIGKQTNMPIIMVNDNSLHDDKEKIYEYFFR